MSNDITFYEGHLSHTLNQIDGEEEYPSIGDCTITLAEARECFNRLMRGLPLEEMQLSLEIITDLESRFCDLMIEVVTPQDSTKDFPF